PALLEAVLADAAARAGITPAQKDWRAPLLWRTSTSTEGKKLHYGFNFSAEVRRAVFPLSSPAISLLDGRQLNCGDSMILGPWGVVIAEECI
ncbi:MAG: hypothetical protein WCO94_04540, partial [Verrucomicrobiota bacterium]